jgi:selenocysteine lyase/cysteine desulfurase
VDGKEYTVNAQPSLDLDFVRSQFPAFAEPSLHGQAFFENAGGSYACAQVIGLLNEYYRRLKVQPYYSYPAATEAGQWMDRAHVRLGEYLNVAPEEIHLGPSTSQNTYVLAQALRKSLKPGDEVIVTNQEHEANTGVFRRLAANGIIVREWGVERDTGALNPSELDHLLSGRTKFLAVSHCSNIVAHVNPIAQITTKARTVGALTIVDGVAFAPHGLPDVDALGADIYLFSLYKTFGPHQGVMVVRKPLTEKLGNEGHHFNAAQIHKRLVPAGPDHAQVAAARGVAEYFDALDTHHGGTHVQGRPERVRELLHGAEQPLLHRLLDYLKARKDVRLLGPSVARERAPTVSFVPHKITPAEVHLALGKRGIMSGAGHFYAVRLLDAMGVDPARGVVRLSFVHYTSPQEMTQLIEALDAILG